MLPSLFLSCSSSKHAAVLLDNPEDAPCYMLACQLNDGQKILIMFDNKNRAYKAFGACEENGKVVWSAIGCGPGDIPTQKIPE